MLRSFREIILPVEEECNLNIHSRRGGELTIVMAEKIMEMPRCMLRSGVQEYWIGVRRKNLIFPVSNRNILDM